MVQQTSGVKDLSSLVRYDDSSLAVIRHVQSIVPIVRPRPNIRSHSVLFDLDWRWIKQVDSGLLFHLEIEEKLISENKRNLRQHWVI